MISKHKFLFILPITALLLSGCSGAKVIVAINKDAESNIFKEARYGVVGDWEHVVPAFTEAVRELTQS